MDSSPIDWVIDRSRQVYGSVSSRFKRSSAKKLVTQMKDKRVFIEDVQLKTELWHAFQRLATTSF